MLTFDLPFPQVPVPVLCPMRLCMCEVEAGLAALTDILPVCCSLMEERSRNGEGGIGWDESPVSDRKT